MDMKLELVPVPVSDIDRAKAFYENVGFHTDHDVQPGGPMRVVQLTPPGSGCSILLSAGLPMVAMQTGSLRGLHLVVADIIAARTLLTGKGIEVGEILDQGGMKYAAFSDPDGNQWTFQEMPSTR